MVVYYKHQRRSDTISLLTICTLKSKCERELQSLEQRGFRIVFDSAKVDGNVIIVKVILYHKIAKRDLDETLGEWCRCSQLA